MSKSLLHLMTEQKMYLDLEQNSKCVLLTMLCHYNLIVLYYLVFILISYIELYFI